MDLAKNFAQWRDRSPEQWIAEANRLLPPVVVGVLVLLIAFYLADLTWRLLESPMVDEVAPPPVTVSAGVPDAADVPGWKILDEDERFRLITLDESADERARELLRLLEKPPSLLGRDVDLHFGPHGGAPALAQA